MKNIGIADFEKLVMERLSNPSEFSDRSLVLWNAEYMYYSIAYRVIRNCCIKYNKENPDDQVWFTYSDYMFFSDDYMEPKIIEDEWIWDENLNKKVHHYGWRKSGIIFNTGCFAPDDRDNWFKFVNTHINQRGGVYKDFAVIVCAQAHEKHYRKLGDAIDTNILPKEDEFGDNCDIYSIQPTFDEWANWAKSFSDPEVFELVSTYIKKNGLSWGFDYWLLIMDSLERIKKDYLGKSIREIPREDIELEVYGCVFERHPAPDFCNFIYGNGW